MWGGKWGEFGRGLIIDSMQQIEWPLGDVLNNTPQNQFRTLQTKVRRPRPELSDYELSTS